MYVCACMVCVSHTRACIYISHIRCTICIRVYTHIHIRTDTHICTHTHTHTHAHARTYNYMSSIQVDYLDSSRNQVVLQMIPRVDYTRKRGHLRSHDANEVQKTRRRPPQKLFDAQAIRYISYLCIGL